MHHLLLLQILKCLNQLCRINLDHFQRQNILFLYQPSQVSILTVFEHKIQILRVHHRCFEFDYIRASTERIQQVFLSKDVSCFAKFCDLVLRDHFDGEGL